MRVASLEVLGASRDVVLRGEKVSAKRQEWLGDSFSIRLEQQVTTIQQ